jgi:hypothetical protein
MENGFRPQLEAETLNAGDQATLPVPHIDETR